jgi:hypothetical protein
MIHHVLTLHNNNKDSDPSSPVGPGTAESKPPPAGSKSFSDIITSLVMGDSSRPVQTNTNGSNGTLSDQKQQERKKDSNNLNTMPQQSVQTPPAPKRSCRPPLSRKFGHPCQCGQSNHHKNQQNTPNNTSSLPPAAYTAPLHLFDPVSKKCLPTSRSRDMLLKECRFNVASPYPLPHQLYHGTPCVYDDLVCDARRNRCFCKPSLHLYYELNNSAFGCVPIGPTGSSDGRTNCKPGYIYNVISKECQKIFDVSELPPTFTTGVSATQFSFVTIVLIWILLLILIVTAKLRKLRSSNLYGRSSPIPPERRTHRHGTVRHQNQSTASAWLHPFIAAVNGHHHLNQHRTTVDRHSRSLDDSGNFNDTDFFLANGNRRLNELFPDGQFAGSQQSLNNPPPKFEEIYPSCPEEQQRINIPPPSNEDLPSYDEAMKLQNTMPPDISHKE